MRRIGEAIVGRVLVALTLAAAVLPATPASAADGDLDPLFGIGGKLLTQFIAEDYATSLAVQGDGKIVAAGLGFEAGFSDVVFAVARYESDGALDPTFDGDGRVMIGPPPTLSLDPFFERVDVAVQSDGAIVLAGTTTAGDFVVVRLLSNGALDGLFGTGGFVATDVSGAFDKANAVAIQSDGKILVAGTAAAGTPFGDSDFALVRYNADGSPDVLFGVNGVVTTDFFGTNDEGFDVAVHGSGVVVVGSAFVSTGMFTGHTDFAVARYDDSGVPDAAFGAAMTGKVTSDFGLLLNDVAQAVAVDTAGRIVVAGRSEVPNLIVHATDFAIARYLSNGDPDVAFGGGDGEVLTDFLGAGDVAIDVVLQNDGKIVAAGWVTDPEDVELLIDFGMARYNGADGSLDTASFGGGDGLVITDFAEDPLIDPFVLDHGMAVALQECRIVMAGWTWPIASFAGTIQFALAGYENGECDTTTFPCPHSHGYWKQHLPWPVTSLGLGGQTYGQAQLQALLGSKTKGDASVILAQQLIAAKLNVAAGADPGPVDTTILAADDLLDDFGGFLPFGVNPSSAAGALMISLASTLDQYNNALLTPECTP